MNKTNMTAQKGYRLDEESLRSGHGRFTVDIVDSEGEYLLTVSRFSESDVLHWALVVVDALNSHPALVAENKRLRGELERIQEESNRLQKIHAEFAAGAGFYRITGMARAALAKEDV